MEDYGRRDWELPCICGHKKANHIMITENVLLSRLHCSGCYIERHERNLKICKEFKLDNLSYVEQVARAKGLV